MRVVKQRCKGLEKKKMAGVHRYQDNLTSVQQLPPENGGDRFFSSPLDLFWMS
jgi:hypothetical protein